MFLPCFYSVTATNSKLDYLPCTVFPHPDENNWYLRYNAAGIPVIYRQPGGIEPGRDCGSMDPLTLRSEEGIPLKRNLPLSLENLRQISGKHICGKIWNHAKAFLFNWPFKTPANVFKAREIVWAILLVFRQVMKQLILTMSPCLVKIDVIG